MKHIRTLSQTPATATAPTVGSLFTLIAGIVQVLATAILAKENQPRALLADYPDDARNLIAGNGHDPQENPPMRHIRPVSSMPAKATSTLCSDFQSDFQVQLCFIVELLTGLFLPIFEIENPVPTDAA